MAIESRISRLTLERLVTAPKPGETHLWLARVAGGLRHLLQPELCEQFLERCVEEFVTHRGVPYREIADAVAFAYGETGDRPALPRWPSADPEAIRRVLDAADAAFDAEGDTGLTAADVLPQLFRPGELVCTGRCSSVAVVRPVEEAVVDAGDAQFVCVNPMKAPMGISMAGRPSPRCQSNVAMRRHLVAEFDNPALGKANQVKLATGLACLAPFAMVVDSGNKSLHCYYLVENWGEAETARFFAVACRLGADPTRWDSCGWLRMPGGLRVKADGSRVRQKIRYWNPEAIAANKPANFKEVHGSD